MPGFVTTSSPNFHLQQFPTLFSLLSISFALFLNHINFPMNYLIFVLFFHCCRACFSFISQHFTTLFLRIWIHCMYFHWHFHFHSLHCVFCCINSKSACFQLQHKMQTHTHTLTRIATPLYTHSHTHTNTHTAVC